MAVLVIGATSQIGHFLLPRLRDAGETVIALTRGAMPPSTAAVQWQQGALPEALPDLPCDAIVSFGPLDDLAAWLDRRRHPGPARLVATSSMSAESKRESRVESDRRIAQRLRDGEARLIEQCERRSIRWTILRPTLIYGAGLDKSLTPIAKRAMRWRIFPLPKGHGLRQPIHADDVALAAMQALTTSAAAGRILSLGGGERLPAGEMFARVRRSLPSATMPVPLPAALLKVAANTQPWLRGPLQRLEADLVADNREAESVLGLHPRAFQPTAATWGLGE